jgi:hypothetical protein
MVVTGKRPEIPVTVKPFVSELIQRGWSCEAAERPSFNEIFEELRAHHFCICRDGIHRSDVESYVKWIGEWGKHSADQTRENEVLTQEILQNEPKVNPAPRRNSRADVLIVCVILLCVIVFILRLMG